MRKAYIILTGIFFTLLFTACRQFTADIDDYLSYWSAEAYIADSTIKAVVQNDLNNIPSVPSAQDVPVTFNLKNSKSFPLDLPPEADVEKKVIVFEHLAQVPKFGDDYTIVQSEDCQSLILTYKATFLQRYEWGEQDLSSTMTLYAKDGRKFKQTYTFKVKANTPPPKPTFAVARTTGTPSYYVLCITAPETDMRKTVAGRLLHKDLAHVEINETPYAFSVNEAEKKFVKPESDSFITLSDVAKLTAPDADKVPTGGWVLYYKTDVEVKEGAAKKAYTVRLADEQGLVSAPLNASTKPNRPAPVQISLIKGISTADVNSDNTETTPHIIGVDGGHKPATLRLACATAGSTIYYTLTEIVAGSLASPLTASGAGSGVDISLPIQPGKTEAEYTLTVRAEADGFETGAERTLYYKITAQNTDTALSELKLTEGSGVYSAALIAGSDSAYICKIPFTESVRNLTLTATTANSRSTITAVTVDGVPQGFTAANTVTLTNAVTLPNSLPAQAVVKITVTGEDPSVSKEYTLTVAYPPVLTSLGFTSGGTPVSFSTEGGTTNVPFNKHTFEYYIFAAQLSPSVMGFTAVPESDATYTVKVNGTAHTGTTVPLPSVGGETLVTFTVEKAGLQNEYNVHIKRKSYTVTLKAEDSDGGTISVTNTTGAGIGPVTGNNSAVVTVTAEIGATITATATPKTGYTFKRWRGTGISYPTNVNLSYLVGSDAEIKAEFKSPDIYVRGTNGDWYNNSANVPEGAEEGDDFTGTGSKKKPYKTVSKALTQCTESGRAYTIFVDGTINENVTLNIPSDKKVTIESLRKTTPAVIEEKRVSPTAEQYLVKTAGTLTLDSVILKANITGTHVGNSVYVYGIQQTAGTVTVKGNTTEIRNFGHGVNVEGGTFTMENGSICNNYVNGGASGVEIGGGTFILKGGSIKDNAATSMAGVYVKGAGADNKGTFTMTGGEISGNKAKCLGGGIYVGEHGQADISGGTIQANHAAGKEYVSGTKDVGGGGIYIEKGTVNFTGGTIKGNYIGEAKKNCGAGVLIGEQGTFNMSGGTINDCTTEIPLPDGFGTPVPSEPSRGIGVYVAGDSEPTRGTFNMTGGIIINCKPRSTHTADGGGVYVGREAVFRMKGSAIVTPTLSNAKGDNDVYLDDGASKAAIIVTGELTNGSTTAARLTMKDIGDTPGIDSGYYETRVVVEGGDIVYPYRLKPTDVSKFRVTPSTKTSPPRNWKVVKKSNSNAGELKIDP